MTNKINIEKFSDGIAFYIGDYEVAFYNKFTGNIRYNKVNIEKAHPEFKTYGCIELPLKENIVVMETVKNYVRKTNDKEPVFTLSQIKDIASEVMHKQQIAHIADDPNHYLSKGIQMLIVELMNRTDC